MHDIEMLRTSDGAGDIRMTAAAKGRPVEACFPPVERVGTK
jgi:hypothetical protein